MENLSKETKKELQTLRTKLNVYRKYVGKIEFGIEHFKKGAYDYGEASEDLLIEIKNNIKELRINLANTI